MTLAAFATAGGFAVTIDHAAGLQSEPPSRAAKPKEAPAACERTSAAADAILRAAGAIATGEA